MKAKDCAEIWLNSADKETALNKIGGMFVKDTIEIIEARKLTTATALNAVLKEQSNKWKAFCRQTNGELKEEGFEIIVADIMPELKPFL